MNFTRYAALAAASTAALALAACTPTAEETAPADASAIAPTSADPIVGGAAMSPNDTIVANASKASTLSTLVSAVTAAGLVETLSGAGPFTVFAPDNAAFAKVPAATLTALMAPAGKADLSKILTYHVVSGRVTAADLTSQIQAGGGKAELTTVQGGKLTASVGANGSVILTDAAGGTSTVTQADVMQSNGVVHVIDTVVMPG
jgi:uncharacterized surface protein with fasciclin (FAS1) repeats